MEENGKNTILQIKSFLNTPENPVTMQEFKAFWESCSDEEKEEFKNTPLPS